MLFAALAFAALGGFPVMPEPAVITVHPLEVANRITRHMTGACLEDVNHEVYGGIYSQMIFGESFQEPAPAPAIEHFAPYGGDWRVRDGELHVGAGEGPKLIAEGQAASASVEAYFEGNGAGNAGLILSVTDPGTGADNWVGYEIALDPARNVLVLGWHNHDFRLLHDEPVTVPVGQWVALSARVDNGQIDVDVAGKRVLSFKDESPLPAGAAGLRVWTREARFRNFVVDGKAIPFVARKTAGDVSGMWRPVVRGDAEGGFAIEQESHFYGRRVQRIAYQTGSGAVGIENRGLNRWGMSFVANKPYEGRVRVKTERGKSLYVALESADGSRVYATEKLDVPAGDWKLVGFHLSPNASDPNGRFAIYLKEPGSILLGYAFLQPGVWGRFRDLPVRRDVADGLLAGGFTVLRYGGSMVNAPEYRWKKMIGPRESRPPYQGLWYPYSSNGWGIVDFIAFCRKAGFLSIPAFNMDETPEDMADFVEYVNGPASSEWGQRRAWDGFREPFHLKYLELGNEETINEHYFERFKPMAEAIWAKEPDVTIVVGGCGFNARITDPHNFEGGWNITTLAVYEKILKLAKEHKRPIWIDVHVCDHNPRDPDDPGCGFLGLFDLAEWLGKLVPGAEYKVCVFEENAFNHAVRRALGHAHAINTLERHGDTIPIVCCANCLQPDGQNDNGWDQGLLFLTPAKVWGQPPYYVTQMVASHYLPKRVRADCEYADLDITATTSEDGHTLQLQVVNMSEQPVPVRLDLGGFAPKHPAKVTQLSGALDDVNTADNPNRVVPHTSEWEWSADATFTFPPLSFSILRFE